MLFQPNIDNEANLFEEGEDWVDFLMKGEEIRVEGVEGIAAGLAMLALKGNLIKGGSVEIPSLDLRISDKGVLNTLTGEFTPNPILEQ